MSPYRNATASSRRTFGRRRRGGAVLETILILPILLSLAFGIVEFGQYFYVKHTMEGASRDGCRAFIPASSTLTDVQSAVDAAVSAALPNLGSANYTITVVDKPASGASTFTVTTANQANCVAGDTMTVTVSCTWGTAGQGYRPWGLIGSSKVVSGVVVMRKEG